MIVKNISNVIHMMDPLTGQTATMTNEAYWRNPPRPIITAARSRLTRYVVLGKEVVVLRPNAAQRTARRPPTKSKLAALTMAQESDLGLNDQKVEDQRSHLGYLLKCGDVCLAYDLKETQLVDEEAEALRDAGRLPAVVVVRKLYGGSGAESTSAKRVWRLERLPVVAGDEEQQQQSNSKRKKADAKADEMDEEDFMQEVEADKDMRLNMNLYKSDGLKKASADQQGEDVMEDDDDDKDDDQRIQLDELLDGLALEAGPDEEDVPLQQFFVEGEKAAEQGLTYVSREEARHVRDKDAAVPVSTLGKAFQS